MKILSINNINTNFYNYSKRTVKQNTLSFTGTDSFEKKQVDENSYKDFEKLADACFESQEFDAAIYYYEKSIDLMVDYICNVRNKTLKDIKNDYNEANGLKSQKEYERKIKKYNELSWFKKLFKKEPKKPEKTYNFNCDDLSNGRYIIILSNMYKKAGLSYSYIDKNDIAQRYIGASREILKYTKIAQNILNERLSEINN